MLHHSAGDDLLDQLELMADDGFTALEVSWMTRRSVEEQERIEAYRTLPADIAQRVKTSKR